MKLLLLHGGAKQISRKKLLELKQKFDPNNVEVFEEGSSNKDITDNLVSTSLFSDERLVVLENPPEDLLNLSLYTIHYTLILWFDHEVKRQHLLDWVSENKGEILFFPEGKERTIFPFLDMLAYGDKKAFLELKKLKDIGFDTQYFITMIFYLLRNLVTTPKKAPEFVRQKLIRQRRSFKMEDLINFYKQILEIDFKIKSGLLDINQAEFLLVNKFINKNQVSVTVDAGIRTHMNYHG